MPQEEQPSFPITDERIIESVQNEGLSLYNALARLILATYVASIIRPPRK